MSGIPKSPDPNKMSRRERQIFDILIGLKKATLSEIIAQMDDSPTRQAVRALLKIMKDKGYVDHEKNGREFVFFIKGVEEEPSRLVFRDFISKFFGNSLKDALASHLGDEKVNYSKKELKEIEALFQHHSKDK